MLIPVILSYIAFCLAFIFAMPSPIELIIMGMILSTMTMIKQHNDKIADKHFDHQSLEIDSGGGMWHFRMDNHHVYLDYQRVERLTKYVQRTIDK